MALVRNTTSHGLDTSQGTIIPPRRQAVVDINLEHEAELLASGQLEVVDYDADYIPGPGEPDPTSDATLVYALLDNPADGDLLVRGSDGVFQAVSAMVTFVQVEQPNFDGPYLWIELDGETDAIVNFWKVTP